MNTLEIVALCAVLVGLVLDALPIVDALLGNPVYHARLYHYYLFPGPAKDKHGLPSTDVFANVRFALPSPIPWVFWSIGWYILVFHQPSTQSPSILFLAGILLLLGLHYVSLVLPALEGLAVYAVMLMCRPLRDSFLDKHPQGALFVGDAAGNIRRYHKFVLISVVGRGAPVRYVIFGTLPFHANVVAAFSERYHVCRKYIIVHGGGSTDWKESSGSGDVRTLLLDVGGCSQGYGAADRSQVLAVLEAAFRDDVRLPDGSSARVTLPTS